MRYLNAILNTMKKINVMKKWLRAHTKEENTEFAKKVGTSLMYLEQLGMGIRKPSSALAKKIHLASGKQVDKMELLFPDG